MRTNNIIEQIRKTRHDFAEAHGNDLVKMAQAVSAMVDHARYKVVSASDIGRCARTI